VSPEAKPETVFAPLVTYGVTSDAKIHIKRIGGASSSNCRP